MNRQSRSMSDKIISKEADSAVFAVQIRADLARLLKKCNVNWLRTALVESALPIFK